MGTSFVIGDIVRIINTNSSFHDQIGVIICCPDMSRTMYRIEFLNGYAVPFDVVEFEIF